MSTEIEQIKELRNRTGAGVGSVKEALDASAGDIEKAIHYLREKGLAKAVKRAGKSADNGIFGIYLHSDARMVVVVEVASETDFAARSKDMQDFANQIALHIAASNTEYVNIESIPEGILEKEKELFAADVQGKPEEMAQKIIDGKLQKFYKDNVLLNQPYFADESKTVQDLLSEFVAKIGEKIEITRFIRLKIAGATTLSNII